MLSSQEFLYFDREHYLNPKEWNCKEGNSLDGDKPAREGFGGEEPLGGPLSRYRVAGGGCHYIVFYEVLVCGQHESLSMLHCKCDHNSYSRNGIKT